MSDKTLFLDKSRILVFAWMLSALFILCLSYFGRPLQHWATKAFERDFMAFAIAIALLAIGALAIYWQYKRSGSIDRRYLLLLSLVLIIMVIIITVSLPRIEERMHFITFGIFGFFSKRLLPLCLALIAIVGWSSFDELFQAWLPDRVGDPRDVVMNIIAGVIGLGFAWRQGGLAE